MVVKIESMTTWYKTEWVLIKLNVRLLKFCCISCPNLFRSPTSSWTYFCLFWGPPYVITKILAKGSLVCLYNVHTLYSSSNNWFSELDKLFLLFLNSKNVFLCYFLNNFHKFREREFVELFIGLLRIGCKALMPQF